MTLFARPRQGPPSVLAQVLPLLAVAALFLGTAQARANPVDDLLRGYQKAGAANFSAKEAEAMWTKPHLDAKTGQTRRCSTCHTEDLRKRGKHATTGKAIDPLAPSANSERLTDPEKIEKWFGRNCKWTLGRECTPQEKGNFLVMIRAK